MGCNHSRRGHVNIHLDDHFFGFPFISLAITAFMYIAMYRIIVVVMVTKSVRDAETSFFINHSKKFLRRRLDLKRIGSWWRRIFRELLSV